MPSMVLTRRCCSRCHAVSDERGYLLFRAEQGLAVDLVTDGRRDHGVAGRGGGGAPEPLGGGGGGGGARPPPRSSRGGRGGHRPGPRSRGGGGGGGGSQPPHDA